MMQIPPPSAAHLSLVSELFSPNNSATEDTEKEPQALARLQQQLQQQQQRPGFSSPSFALRAQPSRQNVPRNGLIHRPRQQQEPSRKARKVTRRRSPSQKILFHPPGDASKKRDENGNPLPACGPLTCFSYRTMEKEYEKDTLRMLERIQKSRSFEKKPKQHEGQDEGASPLQWSCPQLTSYPEDSAATAAAATGIANEPFRAEHDSGFYIGNDGVEEEDGNGYGLFEDARGGTIHTEPPRYEEDDDEDDGIFALDL